MPLFWPSVVVLLNSKTLAINIVLRTTQCFANFLFSCIKQNLFVFMIKVKQKATSSMGAFFHFNTVCNEVWARIWHI